MGMEFARQIAAEKTDLVLVARRGDRLAEVADALREEFAVAVTTIVADLSDPSSPEHIFERVRASGTDIDYLINNAGIAGSDLLGERDWQTHSRFFQLMMLSVAHLCHLFIPGMRERGFGRVINIASVAGRIPRKGGCNYGPSKAYLIALSEDLNLTLSGTGVNVCALCPGFTHTDFHATAGLLGIKAKTPGFLWYRAEVVVRDGLRAVERRKSVYLSGRLYRWIDPLFQSVFTRRLFRMSAGH